MLKKLKIQKLIIKLKIRENQHMSYKKKFKLPGPFWDTFIKKKFSEIFLEIHGPVWDTFIKKIFLATIKKNFLKL